MAVRAEVRPAPTTTREQSRARYPHEVGIAEREGGRIAYEVYGAGDPPLLFVPPWQIVHSRVWKAQLAEFPRRHRCVAYDARGNGRSDRPTDPAAHATPARVADLGAVMDATGLESAVLIGLSGAARPMLFFATAHPDRVLGLVFVAPATPLGEPGGGADVPFEEPLDSDDGWNKDNIHFWRRDFRSYLDHFFGEAFPERHSTKQHEDAVGYGLDTDPDTLAATVRAPRPGSMEEYREVCASIRCPTLVIQGTDDRITHETHGTRLAEAIPGARLALLEGSGHIPNARDPIVVNLLIRDFLRSLPGADRARP